MTGFQSKDAYVVDDGRPLPKWAQSSTQAKAKPMTYGGWTEDHEMNKPIKKKGKKGKKKKKAPVKKGPAELEEDAGGGVFIVEDDGGADDDDAPDAGKVTTSSQAASQAPPDDSKKSNRKGREVESPIIVSDDGVTVPDVPAETTTEAPQKTEEVQAPADNGQWDCLKCKGINGANSNFCGQCGTKKGESGEEKKQGCSCAIL